MANMDDFIVKIKGDVKKLSMVEDIIKEAAYEGGGSMESFLEEYGVDIGNLKIDADCHHISLFTYLFDLAQYAKELENKASRNFISGCILEGDTLIVYVYGPDGGEDFFNRIVELSPMIQSYSIEAEEDYETEDEEDYEDW